MAVNQKLEVRENRPPAPPCPPYMKTAEYLARPPAATSSVIVQPKQEDGFVPGLIVGGIIGGVLGSM